MNDKKPDAQSKDAVRRRPKKAVIWGTILFLVIFIPAYILIGKWLKVPLWWILPFLLLGLLCFGIGASWGYKNWMQNHEDKR
jgi:hypothetical protein